MLNQDPLEYIIKNIDKEELVDHIIKLIAENKINPNKYIRNGENLFHFAVLGGSFKLVHALCENKLVDVNVKTQDGTPILALLAQVYQSSRHKQIFEYLLNNANIDLNATNSSGFTASAWTERLKRTDLMLKLLSKESITAQANKVYQIKMTCLKFALKNPTEGTFEINSLTLPESYRALEPEGYTLSATIPNLQKSFNTFVNEFLPTKNPDPNTKSVFVQANKCIQYNSIYYFASDLEGKEEPTDYEQFYNKFKQGERIAIHSSSKDHAASVVLHANKLYRCNKGLEKHPKYSVVEYEILNPDDINVGTICRLLTSLHPEEILKLNEVDGLPGKAQHTGNCTVASPKKAIHAIIYNCVKEQYPSDVDHKAIAKQLYKQWSAWDRTWQIQNLLDACKDDELILISLLKYIFYVSTRFPRHHIALAQALLANIKSPLQKDFENLPHPFALYLEKISLERLKAKDEDNSSFIAKLQTCLNFIQNIGLNIFQQHLNEYAIMLSAAEGNNQKLKELIASPPVKQALFLPGNRKFSCLHIACLWGNEACAEILVQQYPDLVNTADQNNNTPLHITIILGNTKLVKLLLENGADSSLSVGTKTPQPIEGLFKFTKKPQEIEAMKTLIASHRPSKKPRP